MSAGIVRQPYRMRRKSATDIGSQLPQLRPGTAASATRRTAIRLNNRAVVNFLVRESSFALRSAMSAF